MADISSRKLAVLLHADVVGSTALVQIDEEVAHGRMRNAFQRFSTCIEEHGGITHEIRGDALIAEFPRVSDAVTAAKQFQSVNSEFNESLSDEIRPEIRIGIAMGEVVIADGTVTGEGIVLAQRLEQVAESGGVCIQAAAYETMPKRLGFNFSNLGDTVLKGFNDPVRVYALMSEPLENATDDPSPDKDATLIELPDEPSIAVLPFTNMSADPEQEFFSDGISEDIITALSKIRGIMVVARNSTFTYKGQAVDIKQVGKDQGVRYVLEGSVRKAANRVRVTAQLIDASTGHHVWAEKYDRELDDIFAVQDELMREIVVSLDVELREGEQVRVWASGTNNVEAWELVRLSTPIVLNRVVDDLNKAKGWIERALELDPSYATAWVMLGWFHQCYADVASGLNSPESMSEELNAMQKCAQNAIDVDPYCADAYSVMAMYHMEHRDFDLAIENAEKSIDLAPGNAENLCEASAILNKCGDPHRALELAQRAMRLCPMYRAGFLRAVAAAYRFSGQPELSAETFREAVRRQPDLLSGYVNLSSVLGELGRLDEAKAAASHVMRLNPDFSISQYGQGLAYKKPEDLLRVEEGLRLAGLPD